MILFHMSLAQGMHVKIKFIKLELIYNQMQKC